MAKKWNNLCPPYGSYNPGYITAKEAILFFFHTVNQAAQNNSAPLLQLSVVSSYRGLGPATSREIITI